MEKRLSRLGSKLALWFTGVALLFVLALSLVLRFSVSSRFLSLEDEASAAHARRLRAAFDAERSSLVELVREYAAWDESYAYVTVGDPGYRERNFPPEWLAQSGIDAIVYVSAEGQPLIAGFVTADGLLEERPDILLPALVPAEPPDKPFADAVVTTRGILVYAWHPVTSSDFQAPKAGAIAFARFFGRAPLARLRDRVEIEAELLPAGSRPPGRLRSLDPVAAGGEAWVGDRGGFRELVVPVADRGGREVLGLGLSYPRRVEAAGRSLLAEALLGVVLAVVLALGLLLLAVRRFVVSPILAITAHLDRAACGEPCARLDLGARAGRHDEIGLLADHADDLLAADEAKRAELAELNAELARRAATDHLTGLANRRSFEERLDAERRRILRDSRREARHEAAVDELALAVCDIDFFKLFNDRYGHSAGDACLRAVADAIRGAIKRPADFACRYGGEEFVVVLPRTDEAGALVVAEAIRQAVEDLGLPHGDSGVSPYVTMSLGVAAVSVTEEGFDRDALFERADAALYRAKSGGRNRVEGSLPA